MSTSNKPVAELEKNKFREISTDNIALAVVNPDGTSIAGSTVNSLATVNINTGNAHIGSVSIFGNLAASLAGNVTLNPSPNWIGLVSLASVQGQVQLVSTPTLFAVVNTGAAGIENSMATVLNFPATYPVTQSGNWNLQSVLSLASLYGKVEITNTVPVTGAFYQATQPVSIAANVNSLATVNNFPASYPVTGTFWQATQPVSGTFWQATQPVSIAANINSLATINNFPTGFAVNSNVTLNPSPNFIGLVSTASIQGKVDIVAALPAGGNYIGLATVTNNYGSNVTISTAIISAAGAATIFIAPASNRFFLTSLHVASLGRSEIEFRSGATTIIPFTALATTGGYAHDWNMPGYPGRAQADGFVANLNSAATVSIGVSYYFQP